MKRFCQGTKMKNRIAKRDCQRSEDGMKVSMETEENELEQNGKGKN
jgi:hypothetical protein